MWVHFVFVSLYFQILHKVNWYVILEFWYNSLFLIIPINFNGSLFYFYFWYFLVFSPVFPLLPHSSSPRGAGQFGPASIFFPQLELNFLTTLLYPQRLLCLLLMLNFRLLGRRGWKNKHVREWCSFCYDFIWNSICFQPICLEMSTPQSPYVQSLCRRRGWKRLQEE